MQALIDGDILVYRCGFAAEKKLYTNGTIILKSKDFLKQKKELNLDEWKSYIEVEPIENALYTTKRVIQGILKAVGTNSYKVYLTSEDKSNFRFKVATIKEYKGNRKNAKKPQHYHNIREYLINVHGAEVVSGIEADDAIGMDMCNGCGTKICCTIDKDLRMIPGLHHHLDWEKVGLPKIEKIEDPGFLELKHIGRRYKLVGGGILWFYAQMLLGDSADNIPKIPKMGPVAVHGALYKAKDPKQAVLDCYTRHFKDCTKEEVDAILKEVATLLWIRRK